MSNPGQPTIRPGATGNGVRRLQRALRRTPNLGITISGTFDSQTETAVKEFQESAGLTVDGIIGPLTWNALPDGGPMPTLKEGSNGDVVSSLQTILTNGADGQWITMPLGIDGEFGPNTRASVEAFQSWGGVTADGVVGDQPGQFRCMQLVPRWSPQSASISSSIKPRLIGPRESVLVLDLAVEAIACFAHVRMRPVTRPTPGMLES
jgi:peptidoglycan hydrolase-like protein with peptidoglycan-binding domain